MQPPMMPMGMMGPMGPMNMGMDMGMMGMGMGMGMDMDMDMSMGMGDMGMFPFPNYPFPAPVHSNRTQQSPPRPTQPTPLSTSPTTTVTPTPFVRPAVHPPLNRAVGSTRPTQPQPQPTTTTLQPPSDLKAYESNPGALETKYLKTIESLSDEMTAQINTVIVPGRAASSSDVCSSYYGSEICKAHISACTTRTRSSNNIQGGWSGCAPRRVRSWTLVVREVDIGPALHTLCAQL